MEKTSKRTKGTDVILHIADDSTEFLEEQRISSILNKYCKFSLDVLKDRKTKSTFKLI